VIRTRAGSLALSLAAAALCALAPSGQARAAEVADSAEAARPVAVGARAPSAEVRDVEGRTVRLDAWVGREPIALVFYRGGW